MNDPICNIKKLYYDKEFNDKELIFLNKETGNKNNCPC